MKITYFETILKKNIFGELNILKDQLNTFVDWKKYIIVFQIYTQLASVRKYMRKSFIYCLNYLWILLCKIMN